VTQSALDGREEVLSWPRHGYKTTKRKGMVWNKLIAAQSILENAPRLKLDNEKKYDNKRVNDSENWNLDPICLDSIKIGIRRNEYGGVGVLGKHT
jgi:hypothetical protein